MDHTVSSMERDAAPTQAAVVRTLGVRWLVGVAIIVPIVLTTGVLWLRHLPSGPGPRVADTMIQIHLVAPSEPNEPVAKAAPQPLPTPPIPLASPPPETHQATLDVVPTPDVPRTPAPTPGPTKQGAGPAVPAPKPSGRMASAFQQRLFSHIERFERYPSAARPRHLKGTVRVLFTMYRDGHVASIQIQTSSGYPELDAEAVDTIRRAEPLPSIPEALPRSLNILAPIAFDLP